MMHRNRKLLDLAHMVDQCQNCGKIVPGCEPAHANSSRYGKGMSIKSHDCFHAALCHECHSELDQGRGLRNDKMDDWQRAFEQTLLYYWKHGWLKVNV